jgi:shikimate 5-dehydrogenase
VAENLSAPMNDANEIDTESLLFGFLAEHAQQDRFSITINRLFKEQGNNAMCIPMNIRPDDIYFTVAGLREAKLNGVALGAEYVEGVVEQLAHASDEVQSCGFCDTIIVKNKELYGEVTSGKAINAVLKEKGITCLGIFGSGKLAKSILTHIQDSGIKELVVMNDRVESCMELMQGFSTELEGITVDIDRASEENEIDLSSFDGFINASPAHLNIGKVQKGTVLIDLKRQSNFVDYAAVFGADYVDNAQFSKTLTQINHALWLEKCK